ncbi:MULTISPECIES: NTF2 fold immunity protein [Bacteroidaceae]|jgi:hypothetical protein|uniref:NTF2 fold immunity protein n=1 Tax=Bacteroidaceae TaxID=815 RepID=UPI000E4A49E8|nr:MULTISPECIES: NTF2 fold immunity protein [Bacteroidaceae]RGV64891.1 hypothetical protein DWW05_21190 [Bacteroides thetaiotaomicron]
MDDITKKILEELVINFISEMNEWEKYCNELDQNTQLAWDEADRMMEQRVASIISKYCTDKERKMSRPNAISWGVEGSYVYDPNKEKIIDIQESRKNRFIVTTRTDDEYLQYVIVKKNNKFLIDSKKRRFLNEDKWYVDYL